jgi:hypothetical protein
LSKVGEKVKGKGKDYSKEKDKKGKKKETCTCNHCGMKGHIEVNCWKKHPSCQKRFSLEGVDFNVDSRCKVILDLLKSELLLKNVK